VAWYFKQAKPRSKVLILDANPDVTSKGALFKKVWAEQYKGIVEYRGQHKATAVDAKAGLIKFDVQEDVKANVINALPLHARRPDRRADGAEQPGQQPLVRRQLPDLRVHRRQGRARAGRLHPDRAGHAQERPHGQQPGKVAAAAIVAQLSGWAVNPAPMLTNTCYSFVDNKNVVHVASVHEYVAAEKTFKTVAGSGGLSPAPDRAGRHLRHELGAQHLGG
jgi:sulfide dehydrogenase [flavocytochrome c] flavoprotein subunit